MEKSLILFARIAVPLAGSVVAYVLWRFIKNRHACQGREDTFLVCTYLASRLGIWLMFTIYMQDYVTSSDPKLYYTPILEHFLAGEVPIRDFFYPYGPFLVLSMVPPYLLLGRTLAGISLFAIFAEAVALFFCLKCTSLLEKRGELDRSWVRQALALYLLNPATLYWTVFQGYHSIVQTAYSMAALYFLVRGRHTTGYALGLFSLAGSKLIAVLDWPALLGVCRPRLTKLLWGAIPLVLTYVVFQVITGDILFPIRYHINAASEGNVWYLLTLLGDLRNFYVSFPGNLLPVFFFSSVFLLVLAYRLRSLRPGVARFSFQTAIGITTFTMSLFFLFSFYSGNYYVPMLMLPASLVVTSPAVRSDRAVWSLLLISALCVVGDAVWSSIGQPNLLVASFSSTSVSSSLLAAVLTASLLTRIACLAMLAQFSVIVAFGAPASPECMILGDSYAVR